MFSLTKTEKHPWLKKAVFRFTYERKKFFLYVCYIYLFIYCLQLEDNIQTIYSSREYSCHF